MLSINVGNGKKEHVFPPTINSLFPRFLPTRVKKKNMRSAPSQYKKWRKGVYEKSSHTLVEHQDVCVWRVCATIAEVSYENWQNAALETINWCNDALKKIESTIFYIFFLYWLVEPWGYFESVAPGNSTSSMLQKWVSQWKTLHLLETCSQKKKLVCHVNIRWRALIIIPNYFLKKRKP